MRDQGASGGSIVVLTGAGVSKESGLDTFRCEGGIWSKVSLEDVATPDGFARNPQLVHAFYNARRDKLGDPAIIPNAAHAALARLEKEWVGEVLVVTQNIDDLHERAGSRNLLHMHGELTKVRCGRCGAVIDWRADLAVEDACPNCGAVGKLRPHVVWFGEMPIGMERDLRGARPLLAVHVDRHVGARLSGGGFRQPCSHVHPGAHRRAEPGAVVRRQHVRRNRLRSGDGGGAGVHRRTAGWPDARLKRLPGGLAAQPRAQRR